MSRKGSKTKPRPSVPEIIDRFENGETIEQIAVSSNVAGMTIYRDLFSSSHLERWRSVQAAKAVTKLESAERDLEAATTMVGVSKGDRLIGLQRWRLERFLPQLYGEQKQGGGQTLVIQIGIDRGPKEIEINPEKRLTNQQ